MVEDRSSLKRSSHFLSIFSCLTPSPFCCFSFWEEVFQRFFYIVFLCKISWPHPTPGDYDMNKLSSVLPEGASIQVSAFLANWFWEDFFKMSTNFVKILNNVPSKENVALHFIELESSLTDEALCKVWLKLA